MRSVRPALGQPDFQPATAELPRDCAAASSRFGDADLLIVRHGADASTAPGPAVSNGRPIV
ncbi:hypothetical protein [Glycomyces lechevalierae]|uniref:Uncharacterized protein n=1 Tax=Glycomyces lechevalierae TaxID=256034 RepID=A0A9X3T9J4_9ACTN|nr:hypothetical protein [Glycomyces lechevalierae]MDA1386563.1 hypothetical protein [Glycomyces lechevalierae]